MKSISDILGKGGVSEEKLKEYMEQAKRDRAEVEQTNTDQEMKEREHREKNNLIQLDLWANNQRGVPNSLLRGPLFAAIQAKDSEYCERKTLHDSSNIKIVYTGKRLTQIDLDVWECALHVARLQNLGNRIEITEYSFLKELGRKATKYEYEWLRNTFSKLCASCVEITHENLTYAGSLIEEYYHDEELERYVLIVNPKLARLYEGNRASWIQWDERQKIGKRKPLAQWLHGYISTHAKWYPHKVETIRDYSGSKTRVVRFFKKRLLDALEHLQTLGLIKSYRIDEKNLVHIERLLSKAQQKHIENAD